MKNEFLAGMTVMRHMKNRVFKSIQGYDIIFDENGELQYPFVLYHYGDRPGLCDDWTNDIQMVPIGDFKLQQSNVTSKNCSDEAGFDQSNRYVCAVLNFLHRWDRQWSIG